LPFDGLPPGENPDFAVTRRVTRFPSFPSECSAIGAISTLFQENDVKFTRHESILFSFPRNFLQNFLKYENFLTSFLPSYFCKFNIFNAK